ncbi:MAG: DUF2868 domain-containing protein [Desulfobacter sp.]
MALKDIMDLDFLVRLDEGQGEEDPSIAARDRDIYRQINTPDLDDASLALKWLEYRKLLFFNDSGSRARLPGALYARLYQWMVRGVAAGGGLLGVVTAYSFLAYHGRQPVNVTLFAAFFILLQALLSLGAGGMMAYRLRCERTGNPGGHASFFQALAAGLFYSRLRRLAQKAADRSGSGALAFLAEHVSGAGMKRREYRGVMFWPFFILCSVFALCFCLGALSGTLFRVLTTDLAFGWQSTLLTSSDRVYDLVSWMASPWSWLMSGSFAVPGPEQIAGSRILLKEGIAGLATENLVAWWPFLCMGILVYGVLPRLCLVAGAALAQKNALARFDLGQPRYRRLLVRLRSPRMDVDIQKTGGTRATQRDPLPRPEPVQDSLEPISPENRGTPGQETGWTDKNPGNTSGQAVPALVLASSRVYPASAMDGVEQALKGQLGVSVSTVVHIGFDVSGDALLVTEHLKGAEPGPVVVLQEVWQPPIRGLLHYYTGIKEKAFPDRPLWIFLTQTPGEAHMGVLADDVNYQVWKTAISRIENPGIVLERWAP